MIRENISLKAFNTFGVEVSAKYFAEISDENQLKNVLKFAEENQLTILFLGGGSNILFTKNFDGIVIHLNLKGISEEILDENHILVNAKSGENWHNFVMYCVNKNYGGIENLSLIPGNVGTSPIQNIGAYGTEIKDVFRHCKVWNLQHEKIEILNLEQCKFGYRDSVFKREGKGKYAVLEVGFKLTRKHHSIAMEYGAIKSELEKLNIENPSIKDISNSVIAIRKSKLPDPKTLGNAGSFFKNPTVPLEQFEKLTLKFPEIPNYPNGDFVKIPAGWLIEQCGWKGKQIGNVASHERQSLVVVNKTGNATGKEIFDFSEKIIRSVKEKFGIMLEREVNVV
ncbi:MAG: UDP-N-acetylmuramate dehydrogenase [Flavobacteriaceae bacterium]|jgi:UDP-N-acetylmuramate dehydrogenase|nr:UDP-N-acetylmuramate dehydrogenase [Flavobacteriaceae bacterium]